MLCKPAFVPCKDGCDSKGKALLSKEGVSTVTGTKRPNLPCLWEVCNVLVLHVSAWPYTVVGLAFSKRLSNGVVARYECTVRSKLIEYVVANTCHDDHVADDIFAICELNANLCEL